MKFLQSIAFALLAALPLADAQTPTVMVEGVVQDVDAGKGVVTLKHGEIANVRMPAMTMGYSVADKKILAKVKAGDKVKFHVEMLQNVLTVTQIETSR